MKLTKVDIIKMGKGVERDSGDERFFGGRMPSKWGTVRIELQS